MFLREITVSFQDSFGEWEEPEIYNIVNGESNLEKKILNIYSPLATQSLEAEINTTLLLPTKQKFRLLHKVVKLELEDYVNNIDSLKKEDSHSLINLSNEIPILLAQSIEVPEQTDTLCRFIVSIKLEHENLLACKKWLEQLKDYGINLLETINKINHILDKQKGMVIKDIRNPHILNTISQLYIELKAIQRAKKILLHSLHINPNNSYTLVQLGKVHKLIGSYDEGVSYYKKAIQIDGSTHAYNGLGAVYRAMQKHQFSIKCYIKSLEINSDGPNRSYVYSGMGAVYFDMELYSEGIECFELAGENSKNRLKKLYDEAIKNNLTNKAQKIFSLL